MGGPGFASRRPNASSLPTFELPQPHSGQSKYQYTISASQGSQTPGSLASVGNLLTPPSTIGGEVSPSPTSNVNTTSGPPPPLYSNGGYSSWSPSPSQHNHQQAYYTHSGQNQQFQHSRVPYSPANTNVRVRPHSPQSTEGAPMQSHYDHQIFSSGPMTPASMTTMAPHSQAPSHHHMQQAIMSSASVSSAGSNPSPVHAQEAFRPPPTPTYYSQQSTPQHSPFPFSTGPGQPQMTLSSTGPMVNRPHMSPATTGPMPSLPAPAVQSPAAMQGRFASYGPVMSNIHNPNGQPMLVGALPHGMVANFNSGHAANMQTMYGPPTPQSQPQNDRPFKCDQCPQSFNRNHDLKRHKRIHLAVKPFPCGYCEKSFSRKDALKRHMLVKGCGNKAAAAEGAASKDSASVEASSPDTKTAAPSESDDAKPQSS
ncbi:hypothetical protein BT63DRAFT_416569 [Microthyrium microscopicum]|uniref:C2H2-type domain-containing protein n=1 Tax=Microthyrium microscopicum TaxID=703497 RepID=A0A6A6U218_9PEZI|nr:hypothetical protein BT63DRAFT_416569 [Microthyrium microscopicum]